MRSYKMRGGLTKADIEAQQQIDLTKATPKWKKTYEEQGRETDLLVGQVRLANGNVVNSRARMGMNNQFSKIKQNNNGKKLCLK